MAILNRYTVLASAVALACAAWAQEPPQQQYQSDQYSSDQYQDQASQNQQVDPPSRVARLAYISGEVSFSPAGENEWAQAHRNRPMATGDKLYTNNGRVELGIGTSSILLNEQSNMDFLTLNDQMTQVELTQGSLSINVRRLNSGEVYEVDTPTIAFVADRPGDYRVDVDPNGQTTTVSVRHGSGDAVGEGGTRVRIDEGQRVVFNDPQLTNYQTVDLRSNDSFDNYVQERVARYERAPARRYVSEEVVGYEDLDEYGSWDEAPEYGHVWYPSGVAADWAPYHDGSWIWEDPWGWTWVDDSPWGFAPFHYGRWAYIGSRWGWIPGPVDVRPVYAPALVAFVGGGGFGVSVSVGGGGPIGWFPLGPRDVYFPSYRVGRDYFRSVNISNTVVNNTVINNYYGQYRSGNVNYASMNFANRSVPRAITAVPATAFASGRPVAASAIAVNRAQLANARIMSRATVAPTAASLVAGRARATPPPATVMSRQVVAAHRPAPAPAPFAQRQALLRQNPGQPLTTAQLRTVAPVRGGSTASTPGAAARSNVRVVGTGTAGAATPAASARAIANTPAMTRQQQAQARQQQQTQANAQARGQGRVQGQLPSSRYTQRGNAPTTPPRESATAQQNASANARFNRGNAPQGSPPPRESATAQQNASANARFNRGNAAPTTPANRAAEARANAQVQQQQRANEQRMTAQQRAAEARTNAQSRANEQRAQAQQQSRVEQQRAQAQGRAAEQQRMQAQTRATQAGEQQRAQAQARMQQQQQAQARAGEQQRAQAQARMQQQQQAQAREAQARAGQQQRAQAQYREPPRPTNQREQPAPKQQAKRKNEKDQQNGGGG